jgi:DNA repair exonuclease SbcCD ATPase subunit
MDELSADSLEINHLESMEHKIGIEEFSSSPPRRRLPAPRRYDTEMTEAVSVMKNSVNSSRGNVAESLENKRASASGAFNTKRLLEKLQQDRETHEKQKIYEQELNHSILENQQSIIDNLLQKEEAYKQEILRLKDHHQLEVKEAVNQYNEALRQKQLEINQLRNKIGIIQDQCSSKIKALQQQQYELLESQEKELQEKFDQEKKQYEEIVRNLESNMSTLRENQKISQKVEVELKEEKLQKRLSKRLLKYEKQVKEIIKSYAEKELRMNGAQEELRNELIHAQSLYDTKQKHLQSELTLKDKRILLLEQQINDVDNYIYTAKVWRSLASDLANLVIHTCTTVEELPNELWTSTTPGIFTSIYDEFHGIKDRPQTQSNYLRKKEEFIIVQRLLLSKCLKFSKVRFLINF